MNARSVMFLIASLVNPSPLNVAGGSFYKGFERRHDISRLILNVPGGEVRSLVDCGALCARSSSCKAFCYSQSTALCHLSQPYDPIVQQYNGSDFECYNPTGCPMTKGYAWYGVRCIKGYTEWKTHPDARDICTQDGGHLYYFKDLEWDMQPIVDLLANDGNLNDNMWIGADDLDIQGQYKWSDSSLLVDGSPVWRNGSPDSANQRCVELVQVANALRLNDWLCHYTRPFVCQIDV